MRQGRALFVMLVAACLGSPALCEPNSAEISYWESVRDSKTPAELEAYLKAYPSGQFAPLARLRLKALEKEEQKSATPSKDGSAESSATEAAKSAASKDAVEANRLLRKAAEDGDARAMTALAINLQRGDGIAKDVAEANRWYRKAAGAGHAEAMHILAFNLQQGDGITKDLAEANRWYRKAAEAGYTRSMYNFALHLARGDGITKDLAEASRWFRKAAEGGIPEAMLNLAVNLQHGDGITKDDVEAVRWFRAAAERGNAMAMCGLGLAYNDGRGVAKDPHQAAEWVFKAIQAGNDFALKMIRTNPAAFNSEFRHEFQRHLRGAGHYDGEIDGDLGSGTLKAIEALHAAGKKARETASAVQPSAPAAAPPPDLGNVKDLDTLE